MKRAVLLSVLPMTILLVGCPQPVDESSGAREAVAEEPPTLEELRNATYQGFEGLPAGAITFRDGNWQGESYGPGEADQPWASLTRDFHVLGDLDGDGADEAVVLLVRSEGGTGSFVYLAVVGRKNGALENPATVLLGDRVFIRGMRIEDGRLLVDVLQAGPDDPSCCPGELATRGFTLTAGGLEPFDTGVAPARLSLAAIGGTEWVLRSWTWDEEAPEQPEVTLQYEDGRFVGQSGCNRYFAAVKTSEETLDALEVGPAAGTRMACPDPAGAIETRFLQLLEKVSRFSFVAGQLTLAYEDDNEDGASMMMFDGREPDPAP